MKRVVITPLIKAISRMRLISIFILSIGVFIVFTLITYHSINGNIEEKRMTNVVKSDKTSEWSDKWWKLRNPKVDTYCNPSQDIVLNEELNSISTLIPELSLAKVIVLIRHGDRGPLRPVRNMSAIVCDPLVSLDKNQFDYKDMKKFINDIIIKMKVRKSNPSLPFAMYPTSSDCHLGHLTRFGALQHLTLGSLLGKLYGNHFGIKSHENFKLKAYTTPYARTFQSAVAFLYGFLKPHTSIDFKNFPSIKSTFGTYFCSSPEFCLQKCKKIDYLNSILSKNKRQILESHPAVLTLLEDLKPMIANRNNSQLFKSPVALFDGLMAYLCHNSEPPCNPRSDCLTSEHIKQLHSYIEFNGKHLSNSLVYKQLSWLKIYGFLNKIIQIANDVESKEKLYLYSAHDITIVALSSALDFFDGNLPPYASRVIIETYSHDSDKSDVYLRLIFNGKDVTRLTEICKLNVSNCLPFKTKDNIHLINLKILSNFITDKFKSITKSNNYENACIN